MRRLLLLPAIVLFSTPLHAQLLEVYGTFSPTHTSNVQTGSVLSGGVYVTQYTSFTVLGVGGGLTFNVLPLGPVRVGLDLRGSTRPGTNGVDTAMGGLKVAFKPPFLGIKPYVEAAGGYVGTRTHNAGSVLDGNTTVSGTTFTNHYGAFEGLAGIDVHLLPFINFRVIEFGAGRGYNASSQVATAQTTSTLSFYTINTGLVLHF